MTASEPQETTVTDPAPRRCPRCDSPDPNRHPAMQFEGEVQPCPHPWHWPDGVPVDVLTNFGANETRVDLGGGMVVPLSELLDVESDDV